MNLAFASAYKQLRPVQKAFVDRFVADAERDAEKRHERISHALYRPIDEATIAASEGLLENPIVRAAIAERINELAAASEITVQRVVKEIACLAFSTMSNYQTIGDDGLPVFTLANATPEALAAIKTVKIEERGNMMERGNNIRKIDVVLHDKLGAIKMLAEYMGMFQPDNPFWRADQLATVAAREPAALPDHTTVEDAANLYGQMING